MADTLAAQMGASNLKYATLLLQTLPYILTDLRCSENAESTENWKAGLNIPTKDTRQQTEVLKPTAHFLIPL